MKGILDPSLLSINVLKGPWLVDAYAFGTQIDLLSHTVRTDFRKSLHDLSCPN